MSVDAAFKLLQNQPNPFKNHTIIPFHLNEVENVKLRIVDVKGRLIREFSDFEIGYNEIRVDAGDLDGSGIYYYQLITEKSIETSKMILIE